MPNLQREGERSVHMQNREKVNVMVIADKIVSCTRDKLGDNHRSFRKSSV